MKSADASWMYDQDVVIVTVALVWGFHVFRKRTVQMKDLQPIVQISLNADLSSCWAKFLAWGKRANHSSRPFERHSGFAHFCIFRMAMWAVANDACRYPMSVSQIASLPGCQADAHIVTVAYSRKFAIVYLASSWALHIAVQKACRIEVMSQVLGRSCPAPSVCSRRTEQI